MPLLWLSLSFLGGIVAADILPLHTWQWLGLGGLGLLVWGIMRWRRRRLPASDQVAGFSRLPLPFFWLWLAFCLGAARYQLEQPRLTAGTLAYYNDHPGEVSLQGVLVEPADVRDGYLNLRVEAERLFPPDRADQGEDGGQFIEVQGTVLARVLPGEQNYRYGDRLRLAGMLQTPPEGELFSYRDYLDRQGVHSLMSRVEVSLLEYDQGSWFLAGVYALKQRLLQVVYQLYPDPEASLLTGILLGVETGISPAVRQAFQATGTSHVIAISGFNISVLAGVFFQLLRRPFGRWKGAALAALGIIFYTVLVGADPPVVRAAILGTLSLAAGQLGRRQTGLNSLAFVAALMALFNPNIPWDVGFQLSFLATLGLVLYADPIQGTFLRIAKRRLPSKILDRIAGPVGEYILLTLAAQVTVLPVMAYHFRQISLSMLVTNPLILPVQPAVMILGGLAVAVGLVSTAVGQILAYLAWPFVAYTIRVVEWFGQFPGGVIHLGSLSLAFVIGCYGLLFLVTFSWPQLKDWLKTRLSAVGLAVPLAGLVLVVILVWRAGFQAPDGRLHLVVLDVGREGVSGEGLLIQTPQGRYVLVNGGPSANRLSDALGRRLPFTHRQLDALVVAGQQDGQLEGVTSILPRYPPAMVLWVGPQDTGRAARNLAVALETQKIPITTAEAGHALDLGDGASLKVLATGKRGGVLLLEWKSLRALLPVGMSFTEMETVDYGKKVGRVTGLLLADSGYAPLNPPEWIESLNPQVVLLSVAPGDRDGLPDPEALKAVEGYTVLRTDWNGWIELSTDGEQMWVEVERK